jgi:hypothetical protein
MAGMGTKVKGKRPKKPKRMGLSDRDTETALKAAAHARLLSDLTISVEDTAYLLGQSKAHIYDIINENKAPFPFIRLDRSVRIPTAGLRAMLGVTEPSQAA